VIEELIGGLGINQIPYDKAAEAEFVRKP